MNEKWSNYILRLTRETREYKYESWYNHYWNEVFEIKPRVKQESRGEMLRVFVDETDTLEFIFYDEKTPYLGISGRISLSEPKEILRGQHESGGRNEYAWSRSDEVCLTLEEKGADNEDGNRN